MATFVFHFNSLVIYSASPDQIYTLKDFLITSAQIHPKDVENASAKKFVRYEILVKSPRDESSASIYRRYTDFLQLYEGLRVEYPTLVQEVVFPKKCFMGNFSEGVVVERIELFSKFLRTILDRDELKESAHFLRFLQDQELEKACQLLDERRSEEALPILENLFSILNKYYMNRSKAVLLVLCRLVAASAHPVPQPGANKWADLALKRFEGVCDADLLPLYVPLIKACVYLFWKTGRDKTHLDAMLDGMRRRGINVKNGPTLSQALHTLDPRTESA